MGPNYDSARVSIRVFRFPYILSDAGLMRGCELVMVRNEFISWVSRGSIARVVSVIANLQRVVSACV